MTEETTGSEAASKQTELTEKTKQANACHDKGYNCAQAVVCAFKEQTGLEEETLFRLTEGLGLGMGCMEGTCGAIAAATILSGLKCSTGHMERPDSKAATYKASASCIRAFQEKNGTIICRELKGIDTGTPRRSCPGCIRDAVEIIEKQLFSNEGAVKPNTKPLPHAL